MMAQAVLCLEWFDHRALDTLTRGRCECLLLAPAIALIWSALALRIELITLLTRRAIVPLLPSRCFSSVLYWHALARWVFYERA